MTETPEGIRYSSDHLWVRAAAGRKAVVGLTDFAQESLGDIVAVDPPAVSVDIAAGQPCGEVESTKSVSDLVAPVSGIVTSVNDALVDQPELINTDPYGEGWLFEVSVTGGEGDEATPGLLSAAEYFKLSSGS
ncbi:glycine cleavage system protein GcvH [Actinoplanes sp. TBRC 11911]|uniref:glycine cleavage system protein GcvH n=1 Tax=Actinoplanes sp. TBRC 11911 TaxID=2729386 RepID=UPI00145D8431|nr:glycine cleavage system protein GcvH [Actinoplanes sp. TBRC 11911]NMO50113.1 glycine cleavage system protein GcvH [Actinoplanes sp. TBRC 11911]